MNQRDWLGERFEAHRARLRAVAIRMLGSAEQADDAVHEAWLRLSRADPRHDENLRAWLTTVVGRVSLDILRARIEQREPPEAPHTQSPMTRRENGAGPEHEELVGDSVSLAFLVALGTLTPAERIAFVLHEIFAVPYEEIAAIVNRTPTAARQLASRARRRIRTRPPCHTSTPPRV